jgi:sialate O-acetylesterase
MKLGYKALLIIMLIFLFPSILMANGNKILLLNLSGNWKFSIGDNMDWAQPNYSDTSWENIKVPSAWEDQGFYGYNGFGWYRKSFTITKEMKNKELYLIIGYIGEVDQVFMNGKLIGFSGSFPPNFSSAHEAKRRYPIPDEFLNVNEKNVISVRVYNHQMEGGIISGEIGIIAYGNDKPDIPIAGLWYFNTGNNPLWKDSSFQDKQWKKIIVPGNWENQGYKDYTGIAWYRKHITISKDIENQKMVLMLGKIKDADAVYINGIQLDVIEEYEHSGGKEKNKNDKELELSKYKYYIIPKNILKSNKSNLISVKILNNKDKGGLVDGPVGLFKTSNFAKYQKELIGNDTE